MTILSRLFVLVAVALLPAIAIQAHNEFDLRRARQPGVQNQALMAQCRAEQQQIVQGIRQVLIALSEAPAIKAKDGPACNAYLAGIKQRFPAFLTFIVTDLMASPSATPTVIVDRSVSPRGPILRTQSGPARFQSGNIRWAVGAPQADSVCAALYGDDGRMGGVIIAPLGLDWLADHLAQKDVPAGAALAIMDRNGTYLARYPDNGRFIGRKPPAGSDLKFDHGIAKDVVDLDGVERIVSFSTLAADSGGLLISAGLDKAQAFTEIRERTQRGIFLIVLSTSLVLVLTFLGARRFIQRPLGQLVHAANQWQLGEYAQRANIRDRSEISRVADAFNTMADALERREQELSEAKEKAEKAAAGSA